MTISLGNAPVTGITLGSTLITGVYLGSTKLWPAAASAGATIVQRISAGTTTGAAKSSQIIALANTPAPGNYLVCLTSTYLNANASAPVPPDASWLEWPQGANLSGSRKTITDAFVHKVVAGDGKSYTFGFPVSTNISLALYEVSGTSGIVTASNRVATNSGLTPQQTIAPAEAGNALALGWFIKQSSADATANTGWTKDLYQPMTNGSMTTFTGTSVAGVPTALTVTDSGTDPSWSANVLLLGPA